MKKEDLTALGLTDEQIAGVQKLNGNDIQREKDKVVAVELERDNYKEQLETAQASLEKFKDVDVDKLKDEINDLNTALKNKETEYQTQLADRDFNTLLDGQINSIGAKNAKAVKALLDIEALKASKNQEADIKAAIEACQKENDYLFGATEPINNPIAPTGGGNLPGADANTVSLRAAMGLGEAK